ncbi:MAG: hypothetical protein ACXIUM_11880 [Wenzhouxiangella sp.]
MQRPLDIDADLTLTAPDGSIRIHARGRGIHVEATSLRVFQQFPQAPASLSGLRRMADLLDRADQSLALQAKGLPVLHLDPAQKNRWLGRLLRVPGLRLHLLNYWRARA